MSSLNPANRIVKNIQRIGKDKRHGHRATRRQALRIEQLENRKLMCASTCSDDALITDYGLDGTMDVTTTGSEKTPVLSISNAEPVMEGDPGTTTYLKFIVSRSASSRTDYVEYQTQDGTVPGESATIADRDYGSVEGLLEFEPYQTEAEIYVPVFGDWKPESDESMFVKISLPPQYPQTTNIFRSTARGVIEDDDLKTQFRVSDARVTEGKTGEITHLEFTVSRSPAVKRTEYVEYTTKDGSAKVSDGDYKAQGGSLEFGPNVTEKVISVDVYGDSKKEGDETMELVLTRIVNSPYASIADDTGDGTIWEPPIIEITVNDPQKDGYLEVTGTDLDDRMVIDLDGTGTSFAVTVSTETSLFRANYLRSSISHIRFNGGPGDDVFTYASSTVRKALPGLELYGGAGDDVLYGSNRGDTIRGGDGNDRLYGFNGSDAMFGGAGDDYLAAGKHGDFLYGGKDNDRLFDGDGNDIIITGGQSQDTWTPGAGTDTFRDLMPAIQVISGDWNGDGRDQIGFYFPSERVFALHGFSPTFFQFGPISGEPLVGDFDGDQRDEVGVAFNQGISKKYVIDIGNVGEDLDPVHAFGFATDQVIIGDWDGDGADQFGVYRQGTVVGPQYFLDEGARGWTGKYSGELGYQFGLPGDEPIVGDWNGDGIDEFGVYRWNAPGGPRYFLDEYDSARGLVRGWFNVGVAESIGYQFGLSGDKPVIGDWDRDGDDDFGVFRTLGPNGGHYYLDENARGWQVNTNAEFYGYLMGRATDVPFVGDWDGDGDDDFAVFRARSGRDIVAVDLAVRGWQGASEGEWGY